MLRHFLYNLVRYVPDAERMEPFNVGVILQGAGRIDFRINADVSHRKDVDAATYRQWRTFFTTEIEHEGVPLFQPDRNTVEFLIYLSRLCQGPVHLSRPLELQQADDIPFDDVLRDLYSRLVATPVAPTGEQQHRPTGAFRALSHEKKLEKRGMRRHSPILVGGGHLWYPYRQADEAAALVLGGVIAIDKVEVGGRLGDTTKEIERLQIVAPRLERFLKGGSGAKSRRYYLLADELTEPFGNQPVDDFNLLRGDLSRQIDEITAAGGRVVRSPQAAYDLAKELDAKLPPPSAGRR